LIDFSLFSIESKNTADGKQNFYVKKILNIHAQKPKSWHNGIKDFLKLQLDLYLNLGSHILIKKVVGLTFIAYRIQHSIKKLRIWIFPMFLSSN
jgi:hypothetical protein